MPGSMYNCSMDAHEFEVSFLDSARAWVASGHDINRDVAVYTINGSLPVRIEEPEHWTLLQHDRQETLLQHASQRGWCGAMRWLLNYGALVEGRDESNHSTPLHVAALNGQENAAVLLLNAGGQVDARNRFSGTPLDSAARYGQTRLCKLLLSHGASLDATNSQGLDPEASARQRAEDISNYQYPDDTALRTADLLAEVRAAGGWNMYVAAPRQELLAFRRELPTLRRAPPSAPAHLERLFLEIPEDVFMHVVSFWRTPRDYQRE